MSDPEKRVTIEDALGEFGFRVRWSVTDHWADVEAFDIVSRECHPDHDVPLFQRKGSMFSPDPVETIDEAEPYVKGYVKWDGCAELDQGCPHWCGARCFAKHIDLLAYIWRRSFELMNRDPPDWDDDLRVTTRVGRFVEDNAEESLSAADGVSLAVESRTEEKAGVREG